MSDVLRIEIRPLRIRNFVMITPPPPETTGTSKGPRGPKVL